MAINFLNTNPTSDTTSDGNPQEHDADTFEIHQHAIVNILPVDGTPDSFILGYILEAEPSEDGNILVCDINKQELEVPIERIQVYPLHEVLIMMNRYNMMVDVMAGRVDPDQFTEDEK